MNFTRNGKIARLPQPLREELNRRLDQGAQGGPLLQWLNSLPEVQAVLAADFGGRPINKQSLSQWRRGGYAEWWRQQETRALAGPSPSTGPMAAWVAARCLLAVREATGPGGAEAAPLKILHEACRDLVALRQANHTAARVQFDLVRYQLLSGLQLDPVEPGPESAPVRPGQTFEILNKSFGETTLVVAQVSKPACRGHAKSLPNNLPPTPFYSAGFYNPAAPPSAPVRPSQTFEIFNKLDAHWDHEPSQTRSGAPEGRPVCSHGLPIPISLSPQRGEGSSGGGYTQRGPVTGGAHPVFPQTVHGPGAIGRPSFGSPVAKPACCGHAKSLPNNHPPTPFYSAGFIVQQPRRQPQSDPVRPLNFLKKRPSRQKWPGCPRQGTVTHHDITFTPR